MIRFQTESSKGEIVMDHKIVSIRDNPEYLDMGIKYFTRSWGYEKIYKDAIPSCINTTSTLPRFYLLMSGDVVIGCYGLITNDFVSRMDLWPYLCALYVDESERGNKLGSVMLEHAKSEAGKLGFNRLYLCTDHIGYYEKYGYEYIGIGYHPWDDESRIYGIEL